MDIPLIAADILQRSMQQLKRNFAGLSNEALQILQTYHWPGNVRELQNEIVRMVVMSPADGTQVWLGAELLSPRVLHAAGAEDQVQELGFLAGLDGGLKERMEQLEARVIHETLIRHRWNKTRAAQELGLSRVGLRSKLSRYGLEGQP
jgi:two-component system response regulator HupR/HoxA